jgi:hypothetical protein
MGTDRSVRGSRYYRESGSLIKPISIFNLATVSALASVWLHLAPYLPLAIAQSLVRSPESGAINRLNHGSYGITVTLQLQVNLPQGHSKMVKLLAKLGRFNTVIIMTIVAATASVTVTAVKQVATG